MPATEERPVAERLVAGDEAALEEILRAHGPVIRVVLGRKYQGVLQAADVEDVLSVALYRVWKNRTRYDDAKGALRTWFFRIADNAARDVLKHGWFKARRMEVGTDPGALAAYSAVRNSEYRINGRSRPSHRSGSHEVEDNHESPSNSRQDSRLELPPDAEATPTAVQQDLREIVASLPEAQQKIITADALSRDDVAGSAFLSEELGLPPSTIRVYRKRAMDRIRSELSQRGHDVPASTAK